MPLAELKAAPKAVRDILLSVPKEHMELVEFTEEASGLAEAYLREGVVSKKNRVDAQGYPADPKNDARFWIGSWLGSPSPLLLKS